MLRGRERIGDDERPLLADGEYMQATNERCQVAAPASIAQRAATTCYLGSIAAALKRPLKFDPVAEKFPGDDEANTMLSKPVRESWRV